MEVHFTPEQEAFIHQGIASGRYRNAEDALREAMARWEEDERRRMELLSAFDEAEADLKTGQYTDYTNETLSQLSEELKQEARAARNSRQRA